MNDRGLDNQFPGAAAPAANPLNSLSPEQLRQMQNIATLIGQGILGSNFINPVALQSLLTPMLAAANNNNNSNNNRTPPNLIDSTSAIDHQPHLQQQQTPTGSGRGARLNSGLDQQISASSLQPPQQQQPQQQRLITNDFTQRLHQQLQQIVQQSQRQQHHHQPQNLQHQQQQPRPSHSHVGEPGTSLTIRQQQSLQNHLQAGSLGIPDQQKRKRGRPPLSKPSTSAGTSSSSNEFGYLNMFSAFKNQQDQERLQNERLQREKLQRLQQERQRELLRKQQDADRQRELRLQQERARQRELRLQQERERSRLEVERQRKAQHRMAIQDIERERRRQHMAMLKNLDAYKRNEEREKVLYAEMERRNKQNELRMYQRRLEAELMKDMKKPVDDMMLKNHKPLATLNRIPGLKLPGKAFADLLMSFEFLYNFGPTIGLEHKTIPTLNTLQLGLLNLNTWAEDQLINLMHQICMFATKDPRFPYTGSLKEIESLERSNEGLSQLLHFYLQVLTLNAKTEMEHEVRLYKLIEQKYFLSLNATQKAEMLAFLCNELLCSQTVTKQVEDTIENVAKLRKDKWLLENEIRKFRGIKTKRELKEEAEQRAKEEAAAVAEAAEAAEAAAEATQLAENDTNGDDEAKDEEMEVHSNNNKQTKSITKTSDSDDNKNKSGLTNGSSAADKDTSNKKDNDIDTSAQQQSQQQNNTNDLDDLEPGMTNDELDRKIDNLSRQYSKTSNKLDRAINSMRANPLGQDRCRRRYWVLPQVGGVFVEGLESSEPEELINNKFTDEELKEYEKEEQAMNETLAKNNNNNDEEEENNSNNNNNNNNNDESTEQQPDDETEETKVKQELKVDEPMVVKEEDDDKDEDIKEEDEEEPSAVVKDEEMADVSEIKDEEEVKGEPVENGSSEVDKNVAEAEGSSEDASAAPMPNLWFSILPRQCCDFSIAQTKQNELNKGVDESLKKDIDELEVKAEWTDEELRAKRHEICPILAKRLEDLEAEQYQTPRKIHPQHQFGWWRITDPSQLRSILGALHERGTRERTLQKHLSKHFQYACNSCKNTTVDFEITSFDRQLAGKNYGAPVPHTDDDSADDLRDGEEEEEEEEEVEDFDEEAEDEKAIQQAAAAPPKKSKRKKASRSARSRRLRARAAARKKVENSRAKLAQR